MTALLREARDKHGKPLDFSKFKRPQKTLEQLFQELISMEAMLYLDPTTLRALRFALSVQIYIRWRKNFWLKEMMRISRGKIIRSGVRDHTCTGTLLKDEFAKTGAIRELRQEIPGIEETLGTELQTSHFDSNLLADRSGRMNLHESSVYPGVLSNVIPVAIVLDLDQFELKKRPWFHGKKIDDLGIIIPTTWRYDTEIIVRNRPDDAKNYWHSRGAVVMSTLSEVEQEFINTTPMIVSGVIEHFLNRYLEKHAPHSQPASAPWVFSPKTWIEQIDRVTTDRSH